MDKAGKVHRSGPTSQSIKDETEKALGQSGTGTVWVREDGAVCFGDNCVVIKAAEDGSLDLQVDPGSCGQQAGAAILDHLVRTAGQGVNIKVKGTAKTS